MERGPEAAGSSSSAFKYGQMAWVTYLGGEGYSWCHPGT